MTTDRYPFELKLNHVGIHVTNLDRSIKWYEEMLGFNLVFRNTIQLPPVEGPTEIAFLKNGDCYVELFERPNAITGMEDMTSRRYWDIAGTKHISLNVKDGEFDRLLSHLESKNATFIAKHRWSEDELGKPGGFGVAFIADPDGNPVELQEELAAGEY